MNAKYARYPEITVILRTDNKYVHAAAGVVGVDQSGEEFIAET